MLAQIRIVGRNAVVAPFHWRLPRDAGLWLLAWDVVGGAAAFALLRGGGGPRHGVVSFTPRSGLPGLFVTFGCAVGALLVLRATGCYERRAFRPGLRLRTAGLLVLAASLCAALAAALPPEPSAVNDDKLLIAIGLLTAVWTSGRVVLEALPRTPARVLVVGSGGLARRVAALTRFHQEGRAEVVGFLDDEPPAHLRGLPPVLGGPSDLATIVAAHGIHGVIVASTRTLEAELSQLVRECDGLGVTVEVVPWLVDVVRPSGQHIGSLALTDATRHGPGPVQLSVKRTIDIVGVVVLLPLLAPLLLAIAVAIKLADRGPVFFSQERFGRDGRPFRLLKFRTLPVSPTGATSESLDSGVVGAGLKRPAAGATRLGLLLRRSSLDELPQLWSVLRGQMSLVGPRPLQEFEVARLRGWELERMRMAQGLTGLWQVLGRGDTPWDERMRLDYMYVRYWSLALDFRILLRTIPAVLSRRGAR